MFPQVLHTISAPPSLEAKEVEWHLLHTYFEEEVIPGKVLVMSMMPRLPSDSRPRPSPRVFLTCYVSEQASSVLVIL